MTDLTQIRDLQQLREQGLYSQQCEMRPSRQNKSLSFNNEKLKSEIEHTHSTEVNSKLDSMPQVIQSVKNRGIQVSYAAQKRLELMSDPEVYETCNVVIP